VNEPTEPEVQVIERDIEIRLPSWLAPAWLMKRLGATVERTQTLEGVEEKLTLEKEFRIGD
jgi:hypothetical protein